MKKELICIVCPVGCHLEINDGVVSGNRCKKGITYAIDEVTLPKRTLTTTVAIRNGKRNRLPVVTKGKIPKDLIFECMKVLRTIEVEAPICIGDVIVSNILNTGIEVVATRSIDEIE